MPQYALRAGQWTAATLSSQVGKLYNVGLDNGTQYFGYCFQNKGEQSRGIVEKSDVNDRAALTSYGSPNLVDRDLVYYPRVTQGRFDGGQLQYSFLDPSKYYDSTLDVSVPGALRLMPQWVRSAGTAITSGTLNYCVALNGVLYGVNGTNTMLRSVGGNPPTVSTTAINGGIVGNYIVTDGRYVYVSNGDIIKQLDVDGTFVANVTAAGLGLLALYGYASLGTAGSFLYYRTGATPAVNNLFKLDLTAAFPVTGVAVPLGRGQFGIVDLCEYQAGIAIAAQDSYSRGSTIWYHDGASMTRLARVDGVDVMGICNCQGDLYFTTRPSQTSANPTYSNAALYRISGGTVARVAVAAIDGLKALTTPADAVYSPVAGGSRVYWALRSPTLTTIEPNSYVVVYDAGTGAAWHLPAQDALDLGPTGNTDLGQRRIATLGNTVATVPLAVNGNTAYVQSQAGNAIVTALLYQSSGWLVSSIIDFATPAISKRFRAIEVRHAPLNAGESITIKAFTDMTPDVFTTSLAANPAGATITHSYSVSESKTTASLTRLTFGVDTVGRTLFYALQLNAGTSNLTSPSVIWVAVEIGGTWVWEFDLDCTARRRMLSQTSDDPQGVTGKDLYFLIRNAYENGTYLTLTLAGGVTYSVTVEYVEGTSIAYQDKQSDASGAVKADEEWQARVILKQVA